MKFRHSMFALCLALAAAGAAQAQVVSWSPRTGDVWIDGELGDFNDIGRHNRDAFVEDIVSTFGAPRYLVNQLLDRRDWQPGDVYYACALAYQAKRSCGEVARAYDEEGRGKGWGVVAMRMGVKPGSAQFHAMKAQMGKSKGHYEAMPPGASAGKGKGHDRDEGRGDEGEGHGNGNGNGNGNGKGKSKGHGR